jgi:hypothetical protein
MQQDSNLRFRMTIHSGFGIKIDPYESLQFNEPPNDQSNA